MTPTLIAMLRVLHVVAGSFWLGAALMNAGFVLPAARAAGPAGGQVMREIVQTRRLPLFFNLAMSLTLASGAVLLWWASGGFDAAWFATGTGICWSIGSALGIAVALLGHFVNAPTARRMARLGTGGPPDEQALVEMRRLQARLLNATRAAAVLLVLAAATMAAGRYAVT